MIFTPTKHTLSEEVFSLFFSVSQEAITVGNNGTNENIDEFFKDLDEFYVQLETALMQTN